MSTAFLFIGFNKAQAEMKTPAEMLWQIGKSKTNIISEGMSNAGLTETIELWNEIGDKVNTLLDWIYNINANISKLSLNLLAWCYEAIANVVLQIPPFIFTSEMFRNNMSTFSIVAIGLVTLGFIVNGTKLYFNKQKKEDSILNVIKRLSLVIVGMGFAPFILEKTFTVVNYISKLITKLGYSGMIVTGDNIPASTTSGFDVLALIGFDILLIGTLIPVLLQNARRFFDLFVLSAITPLALSTWVFTNTQDYFSMWAKAIKDICTVQLIYATFICFIGLFMFLTKSMTGGWEMLFRILIVAGGFWRMSTPPRFVKNMMNRSQDSIGDVSKAFKTMFTLKALNLTTPTGWAKAIGGKIIKLKR